MTAAGDHPDWLRERELPDAVLIELGRLTMAALDLEDTIYVVCRCIKPRHGPYDDYPIGPRIDEALADLGTCPDEPMRERAIEWLVEAKAAMEDRNAVLHGEAVTFVPWPDTTPIPDVPRDWLHFFPRDKSKAMVRIPLTVEGLRPIRQRIEAAQTAWTELAVYPWACYPGGKTWGEKPSEDKPQAT